MIAFVNHYSSGGWLFPLGRTVATPGALALLTELAVNPADLLRRHESGDWGDVCAEDAQANRDALHDGARIFSSYIVNGTKFWIITEADRSATTILLPEEY